MLGRAKNMTANRRTFSPPADGDAIAMADGGRWSRVIVHKRAQRHNPTHFRHHGMPIFAP
jgi:hypothetical protein